MKKPSNKPETPKGRKEYEVLALSAGNSVEGAKKGSGEPPKAK